MCGTILSYDTGSGSEPQLPASHSSIRVNNQHSTVYLLYSQLDVFNAFSIYNISTYNEFIHT
jgi:hypothetical protein